MTHVASPAIVLEDRIIQRCGICGHKLIDMKKPSIQDDSPPLLPWTSGKFIYINPAYGVEFPNTDEIPSDLCYDLA